MFQQVASCVWMIRPANFYSNPETAKTNAFQQTGRADEITAKALGEFDAAVNAIRNAGVRVVVSKSSDTGAPDAIFPNNWISFHHEGSVLIYPMLASSRRRERNIGIPEEIEKEFLISRKIDLSGRENQLQYLEGTGSIVFDHPSRIAYAVRSDRTNIALLKEVCSILQYEPFVFSAMDQNTFPVYHTNVVLSIGEGFSVLSAEAIPDANERTALAHSLKLTGRELVEISKEQMHQFAGNMLQVKNSIGEPVLLLSQRAMDALQPSQRHQLEKFSNLIPVDVGTIETYGGGSIRCMLAEIFLPLKLNKDE